MNAAIFIRIARRVRLFTIINGRRKDERPN
jgi:hypothetical protein